MLFTHFTQSTRVAPAGLLLYVSLPRVPQPEAGELRVLALRCSNTVVCPSKKVGHHRRLCRRRMDTYLPMSVWKRPYIGTGQRINLRSLLHRTRRAAQDVSSFNLICRLDNRNISCAEPDFPLLHLPASIDRK